MQYETDEEKLIEEKNTFDWGTFSSIFSHDRYEDLATLFAALMIAIVVAILFK